MQISKICFFTGHRKLPTDKMDLIMSYLEMEIINMIDKGVNTFISGGALGFDTICANAILKLKEQYPHIKLLLFLPCHNHTSTWPLDDKYRFKILQCKVDKYYYVVNGNYTPDCMKKRNYKMVDYGEYCIAFCTNERSGTGQTVRYATSKMRQVVNIADKIN